jgi:hypothetical protein
VSNVSEILDSYARDWGIDQTPLAVSSCTSEPRRGLAPAISAVATVRENLQKILDVVPSLLGTGNLSGLEAFRMRFTAAPHLSWEEPHPDVERWTRAARESSERIHRELTRSIQTLDFDNSRQREESRAERALQAVSDLASWLGVTGSKAADIAGGYRRSYYNWVKGVQPYEATTLNLFEAHAFVSALVDALGDRGAREWLAVELDSQPRSFYLRDSSGLSKLSKLASRVLFQASEPANWSPDDELRHIERGQGPEASSAPRRRNRQRIASSPRRQPGAE